MVSKRKAKKIAKKATSNTNPGESPNGDKKQNEQGKTEPKKTKHIIGFGQKPFATLIHAVSNVGNSALCDHRAKGFEVNHDWSTKDCTCKACRKFGAFKALAEVEKKTVADAPPSEVKDEAKKEAKAPVSELPPSDEKPKTLDKDKVTKAKGEVEKEEDELDEMTDNVYESIKQRIDIRFKRLETRLLKKLGGIIEEAITRKPDFFLIQNMVGKFAIVHEASRLVLVDGMVEETANKLLPIFLEITHKWDGTAKMPKDWVTAIKNVIEKHMPTVKADIKKSKVKVTRKIKRRKKMSYEDYQKAKLKKRLADGPPSKKKPRRVIKRRSRHD